MSEKNEDKYFTLNTINQLGLERNEKLDAIEEASGGGGGGDATAANQVLQLNQETVTASNTSSIDNKISQGSDDTLTQAQQVLGYARKDASPSGLRALKCADDGTLHNFDTGLNLKITCGADNTLTQAQQVISYMRNSGGTLDATQSDADKHLKTVELKDAVPTAVTTTNVNASGTFTSSTIDLNGYSAVAMLGNTTNTTDEMRLEVSIDNSTFFKDPTSVLYDFTTGDFVASVNQNSSAGAIRYIRLTQTDTTTTAFTVQFGASRR